MDIFHSSSPNKDFSDDSLMVLNESIDPSASSGPALTNAGLEDSPYGILTGVATELADTAIATASASASASVVAATNTCDDDDGDGDKQKHTDEVIKPVADDVDLATPTDTISEKENEKPMNTSSTSSGDFDVAATSREESHWEYKSVLKETATDCGNREEALSQVELQREENIISFNSDSTPEPESTMEFAKNYSDDLLMGQNDGSQTQGGAESHATNADLADFELPPYSGSSSGSSEPAVRQQSPTTSTNTSKAQSSTPSTSCSQSTGSSQPSLTALRDLLKSNYSRISHIFHWNKPIESGVCFAIGMTLIIALTFFSIISVVAYSTLGLMLASGSIRLYKTVMKNLNRSMETPVDHIWNKVLALNMSSESDENVAAASFTYFKQVILVEDKMESLKFAVLMNCLTYIGAWFNGMTIITIGYLGLFSVPILYEKNKTKIDELLNVALGHFCNAKSMITTKVGSLVSGSSATAVKKQN